MVTGQFFGVGDIQTLASVGITVNDSGKLAFTESKLDEALQADPNAVKEFFTTEDLGVADKFHYLSTSGIIISSEAIIATTSAIFTPFTNSGIT